MRGIAEVTGQRLEWEQLAEDKQEYDLCLGEEQLAALRWQKTTGSLAIGTTADGSWTFKRAGFLNPIVTVRSQGGEEIATFRPSWGGDGPLEFADGRRFEFAASGFGIRHWCFKREDGECLVTLRPVFLRPAAHVEISEAAGEVPELPLLAVLSWYLVVLMAQDATDASHAVWPLEEG